MTATRKCDRGIVRGVPRIFFQGGCLKFSLNHSARLEKSWWGGGGAACHFFPIMDIGIGRTILYTSTYTEKKKKKPEFFRAHTAPRVPPYGWVHEPALGSPKSGQLPPHYKAKYPPRDEAQHPERALCHYKDCRVFFYWDGQVYPLPVDYTIRKVTNFFNNRYTYMFTDTLLW